ncbi:MAG: alpha/beta fold hydrolase [Candidatus Acidiferrales bacterium]
MKSGLFAALLMLLVAPGAALPSAAQEPEKESPSAADAKQIIQNLADGQFAKVEAQFDARMAVALPPGKLATSWPDLIRQEGAFQAIVSTETTQVQGLEVVKLVCRFANAVVDATVVLNPDGKLGGLSFRPHQEPPPPWSPPPYANQSSFTEQPLTVVNGKFELPGILTVPNGAGPFPAVVLVQGSGPQDEDETIGPNKPFKDLAWGLASRGIAVFRYTKRTEKYGVQSSDDPTRLTVEEEVISDARTAVALVAQQPKIEPKQVFLLGHSLGAFLAPRIATGDAQIAGIVMLAANAEPLEKVVLQQLHYLAAINGTPTEAEQQRIADAEDGAKQIESPGLKPEDKVVFLGATTYGAYWLDLRAYDPLKTAAKLKIPIFIAQGGRDFQVTTANFEEWSAALSKNKNVTLRTYPNLNHLFIPGTGASQPSEYGRLDHVSQGLVEDIAAWILPSEKPGTLTKTP